MVEPTSAALIGYGLSKADKIVDKVFIEGLIAPYLKGFFDKTAKLKPKHSAKKGMRIFDAIRSDSSYKSFIDELYYRNLIIRTIDKKSEHTYIENIYHETHIMKGDVREKLEDIIVPHNSSVYCLIGIAGQGKSTAMKKLMLNIIRDGEYLPFFIELRNLGDNGIIEELINILFKISIDATREEIESLISGGRVVIVLDGFDELDIQRRSDIYNEIDLISNRYKTPIIVSSRPNTEICSYPRAASNTYKIAELNNSDIEAIIRKRMDTKEAEPAIAMLEKNKELMSSMISPILVSLFCACYPESDFVPDTASGYYDRIFNILYEGHDKDKNFFFRRKKFNRSITDMKEIFCAFCHMSLSNNKTTLKTEDAIRIMDRSIAVSGTRREDNDKESALDDIINITSLIKEDGLYNVSFIHRSIQEFHAANFIKGMGQDKKASNQKSLKNGLLSGDLKYHGVSNFLYQIDNKNTVSQIVIPLMEELGFGKEESLEEIATRALTEICSHSNLSLMLYQQRDDKKKKEYIYMYKCEIKDRFLFPMIPFVGSHLLDEYGPQEILNNIADQRHLERMRIYTEENEHLKDDDGQVSINLLSFLEENNLLEDAIEKFSKGVVVLDDYYQERKLTMSTVEDSYDDFSEF